MDKLVYNKGLSGEKPFWVDKPVNNKGLSGGKPFLQTKQMEYYKRMAEMARNEVKDLAADYPEYAKEILAIVDEY